MRNIRRGAFIYKLHGHTHTHTHSRFEKCCPLYTYKKKKNKTIINMLWKVNAKIINSKLNAGNPIVDAQGLGSPVRRVGLCDRMSGARSAFLVVSGKADCNRTEFGFLLFWTWLVGPSVGRVASGLVVSMHKIDGN